jgi:hypothetical protein
MTTVKRFIVQAIEYFFLDAAAFGIMTLSIMTFSITPLRIMTLSIMELA